MAKHEIPPSTANPVRVVRLPGDQTGVPQEQPPVDVPPTDVAGTPYTPNPDLDQFGLQSGVDGQQNVDVNLGITPGLMDTISAIESSPYANRGYGIRGGQATTRQVGQEELSQYQLQQMLASNSPLMRQRAAAGLAAAGSRGLMNSSLAIGASQGAMIAGAQPFALQDAGWYGTTAQDNMSAVNRMEEANLQSRGLSMQAGAARDRQILAEQLSGYGDIRRAMINIEDREDQQGFTGEQNDLNRVWTSSENIMDRSLSQWQTQIDAGVRLGISRENAFSTMYASIMTDTTKGFTAEKKQQAIRDMAATLDARYGQTDEMQPGPFETSYLSGAPDDSLATPQDNTPGTKTRIEGATTITYNVDGSTTITIRSGLGNSQQEFNDLEDV